METPATDAQRQLAALLADAQDDDEGVELPPRPVGYIPRLIEELKDVKTEHLEAVIAARKTQ